LFRTKLLIQICANGGGVDGAKTPVYKGFAGSDKDCARLGACLASLFRGELPDMPGWFPAGGIKDGIYRISYV